MKKHNRKLKHKNTPTSFQETVVLRSGFGLEIFNSSTNLEFIICDEGKF